MCFVHKRTANTHPVSVYLLCDLLPVSGTCVAAIAVTLLMKYRGGRHWCRVARVGMELWIAWPNSGTAAWITAVPLMCLVEPGYVCEDLKRGMWPSSSDSSATGVVATTDWLSLPINRTQWMDRSNRDRIPDNNGSAGNLHRSSAIKAGICISFSNLNFFCFFNVARLGWARVGG